MLKLGEIKLLDEKKEYQATSRAKKSSPAMGLSHKRSVSASLNERFNSSDNALVMFQAPIESLVAPKTPSQIPVLRKSEHKPEVGIAAPETPYQTPKPSPMKTQFLSKDSNIPGFTAWDVDARLGSIESMYANLQETIKSTTTDRSEMEKEVGIYKLKSEYSVQFIICLGFKS